MTLEDAIAIARENDACGDELDGIERCETWEKVLSHPDTLFWVRWFVDYLPTGLHPARDAFHFRMREARKEHAEAYSKANEHDRNGDRLAVYTDGMRKRAADKFDATRDAASQALLAEIKKYLEIEEPQASLPVDISNINEYGLTQKLSNAVRCF